MILFLKIETSGLINHSRPLDHEEQPFILAVAAELVDAQGQTLDFAMLRVRAPEGRKVQAGATGVHGITSRQAASSGVPETCALGVICHLAAQARYVVGHGIEHARDVAVGRLMALNKATKLITRPGLEWIDTMKASAALCKLPSDRDDGGYRWPSLDEACEIICQRTRPPNATWEALEYTKGLFSFLKESGVVEMEL